MIEKRDLEAVAEKKAKEVWINGTTQVRTVWG